MIRWLKKLSGRRLNRPENLVESIVALGHILSVEDKECFKEWSEEKSVAKLHHSLGRWIRNNWGLWDENSKLSKWFKGRGIWHADDMSLIIITSYCRKTKGQPIKLQDQIQGYIKYWSELGLQNEAETR